MSSYGKEQERGGEVGEYGDGDSITINSSCDSKGKGKGPKRTVFKISSTYCDDSKSLEAPKKAADEKLEKLPPQLQDLTAPPQGYTPTGFRQKSESISRQHTRGDRKSSVGSVRIDSAGNYSRVTPSQPSTITLRDKNLSKSALSCLNLDIHIQEFSSTSTTFHLHPRNPDTPTKKKISSTLEIYRKTLNTNLSPYSKNPKHDIPRQHARLQKKNTNSHFNSHKDFSPSYMTRHQPPRLLPPQALSLCNFCEFDLFLSFH